MTTASKDAGQGMFAKLAASGAHQKLLAFASLLILLLGFSLASPNFMQTSNTVSYTHLDVYKRQPLSSAGAR